MPVSRNYLTERVVLLVSNPSELAVIVADPCFRVDCTINKARPLLVVIVFDWYFCTLAWKPLSTPNAFTAPSTSIVIVFSRITSYNVCYTKLLRTYCL